MKKEYVKVQGKQINLANFWRFANIDFSVDNTLTLRRAFHHFRLVFSYSIPKKSSCTIALLFMVKVQYSPLKQYI